MPTDALSYGSLTYQVCLNGACANLDSATAPIPLGVSGTGIGQTLAISGGVTLGLSFQFESVPCAEACTGSTVQLRASVSGGTNASFNDGDIWKVAITYADGTPFYEHQVVATYVTTRVTGMGDFASCVSSCRTLTVPINP